MLYRIPCCWHSVCLKHFFCFDGVTLELSPPLINQYQHPSPILFYQGKKSRTGLKKRTYYAERHALRDVRLTVALSLQYKGLQTHYCSGPMRYEISVIPAKAGIQCWRGFASWTPAFAGVTTSYICGPHQ